MPEHYRCLKDDCPHREKLDFNCNYPSVEDGLPVQCVDKWAEDKFSYFDRYLGATKKARQKYSVNGNAVYLDLFSGPGKCRIRGEKREIPGGALRAATLEEAPFNTTILNDLSEMNCKAISQRIGDAEIHNEDANRMVDPLVDRLLDARYDKLHFAFLDPFSPGHLKFSTIKSLSGLKRLDVMINFPIGPIRRNYKKWLKRGGSILDEFLGTDEWRGIVASTSEAVFCNTMVEIYYRQLIAVGFPEEGLGIIDEQGKDYLGRSIATIKNSRNVILYYLILASKHRLAASIWRSIVKTEPGGQRSLL